MNPLFSLDNQRAMITGATGHLGRAMSIALADAGAEVIVQGRTPEKVDELVSDINQRGGKAKAAVYDLLDKQACEDYFSSFKGKLNILINNAYQGSGGTVETSTDEEYLASYNIGLVSAQRLLKLALPMLKKGEQQDTNASCINIASMYGVVSPDKNIYRGAEQTNPPFYGAVKAALIQWSKYAACEFAEHNIRVNSISPGPFPNDNAQQDLEFVNRLTQKVPMRRIGEPKEMQGVTVFLASQASSFITGENIAVDGGWTAL